MLEEELEARFVEQEHRLVPILQNFWTHRRLDPHHPLRRAATRALFVRLFSPGTAAVIGAGFTAVATLAVMVWQTALIREQNQYFKDQNDKLQKQIDFQTRQDGRQRRTQLIATLYERDPTASGTEVQPRSDNKTREESLVEYADLERDRLMKEPIAPGGATEAHSPTEPDDAPLAFAQVSLNQALLQGILLDRGDFRWTSMTGAYLSNTSFTKINFRGTDFRAARFGNTNFGSCCLYLANFEGTKLEGARMPYCDLRKANFNSADVEGVLWLGADLRHATLHNMKNWNKIESIAGANLFGVEGAPDGFLEWATKEGRAVTIASDAEWSASFLRTFPQQLPPPALWNSSAKNSKPTVTVFALPAKAVH